MPRVENHVQRLNSGDGTPKKSKPKNRKSNETPSGKSMPNTSIRANFVVRLLNAFVSNKSVLILPKINSYSNLGT